MSEWCDMLKLSAQNEISMPDFPNYKNKTGSQINYKFQQNIAN